MRSPIVLLLAHHALLTHSWHCGPLPQQLASFLLSTPKSSFAGWDARVRRAPQPRLAAESGDLITVTAEVNATGGVPAKGLVGLVSEDLAEPDAERWGACCEPAWGEPTLVVRLQKPVRGYFEHSELRRLTVRKSSDLLEGDRVEIVEQVTVKGFEARGMEGTVVDVWTGCDTDPACCCNELATAAVQVDLDPPALVAAAAGGEAEGVEGAKPAEAWTGLFHQDEVAVLRRAKSLARDAAAAS